MCILWEFLVKWLINLSSIFCTNFQKNPPFNYSTPPIFYLFPHIYLAEMRDKMEYKDGTAVCTLAVPLLFLPFKYCKAHRCMSKPVIASQSFYSLSRVSSEITNRRWLKEKGLNTHTRTTPAS